MNRQLIWLGPWADEDHPNRPRPEDHIDPTWDENDRGQVSSYLEGGFVVGAPLDLDGVCTLCGAKMYRGPMQTDGVYIWRTWLAHYVDKHNVRPPQQFIDHVVECYDKIDSIPDDEWQWWDNNPYENQKTEV